MRRFYWRFIMPGKPFIVTTLTTNSKSFAPPWKKSRRFTEANLPHTGGNFSSRFAPRCAQNQRARNHSRHLLSNVIAGFACSTLESQSSLVRRENNWTRTTVKQTRKPMFQVKLPSLVVSTPSHFFSAAATPIPVIIRHQAITGLCAGLIMQ